MSKRVLVLMCSIFLIVPLLFMGCGSDGSTGATGATGATGPPGSSGQDLTANPVPESCNVCHGIGQIRDVTVVHAITGVPSLVVVGTPAVDGTGNLVVNLRAAIDGVPSNAFTLRRAYVNYDNAALTVPASIRRFAGTGKKSKSPV